MFSRWNFLPSYKFTRCKLGPLLFKRHVRDHGRSWRGTETVSGRESVTPRRPLATALVCHTGRSCGPIETLYRRNDQPLTCTKKVIFLIVIIDLTVPRQDSRLIHRLELTIIPHRCVPTHCTLTATKCSFSFIALLTFCCDRAVFNTNCGYVKMVN